MQLKALHSLYEDVHCRYSLSRSKLMELLDPLFNSHISNVAHMQAYLNKNIDPDNISIDHTKILNVYEVRIAIHFGSHWPILFKLILLQECIGFQHQLNIIQNVLNRVDPTNNPSSTTTSQNNKVDNLSSVSSDKLRVLSECLIEMLMHFLIEYGVKVNVTQYWINQLMYNHHSFRRMYFHCTHSLIYKCAIHYSIH